MQEKRMKEQAGARAGYLECGIGGVLGQAVDVRLGAQLNDAVHALPTLHPPLPRGPPH